MDANPHWNFKELLERLSPAPEERHTPEGQLKREAEQAIRILMDTNRELHRRTQQEEAPLLRELAKLAAKKAVRDAAHSREWAISSFSRMGDAFREIKLIYNEIRRARPDGCDEYGYHSVMDSRCDGEPTPPGTVWANKFKSKRGGIVSVRPAEVIGPLIDELIAFRKFFGTPPHS
jgi:hypothetical protein